MRLFIEQRPRRWHGLCVKGIIFIENKIDAAEQPSQLSRYRRLLDKAIMYELRVLVYLTPEETLPTSGEPHFHITYADDIRDWLVGCCDAVIPDRVKHNIKQYVEIIDVLRG